MEETNTTMEQAQTSDGFLSGWGEEPETAPSADQQPEVTEEQGAAEDSSRQDAPDAQAPEQEVAAQSGQTPSDAPKMLSYVHLGEHKTISPDDPKLQTLLQKGEDYDRIRGKYDESKPVMELFGQFAKQSGMSVSDYVSHLRMQAKLSGGVSEAEARRAVELEDREAAVAVKEAEEAERTSARAAADTALRQEEARRRSDIEEFTNYFPDVAKDPQKIPQDVWNDVKGGMRLVSAWYKHLAASADQRAAEAERKASAAALSAKNEARSTGSMESAGQDLAGKDPFLLGWDS